MPEQKNKYKDHWFGRIRVLPFLGITLSPIIVYLSLINDINEIANTTMFIIGVLFFVWSCVNLRDVGFLIPKDGVEG